MFARGAPEIVPAGRAGDMLGVLREGSSLTAFVPALDGADPELRCRAAVASTLLAGLELARDGAITLEQTETWHRSRFVAPQADRQATSQLPGGAFSIAMLAAGVSCVLDCSHGGDSETASDPHDGCGVR